MGDQPTMGQVLQGWRPRYAPTSMPNGDFNPHEPPPGQEASALDALAVVAPMMGPLLRGPVTVGQAMSAAVPKSTAGKATMPGDYLAYAKAHPNPPKVDPLTQKMRDEIHAAIASGRLKSVPPTWLEKIMMGGAWKASDAMTPTGWLGPLGPPTVAAWLSYGGKKMLEGGEEKPPEKFQGRLSDIQK